MSSFATDGLELLTERLEAAADPSVAPQMRRYMRDQFNFLGVKSPVVVEAMKPIIAQARDASGDDVITFAAECWQREHREYQYAGALLLRRRVDRLNASHLDAVRTLIQSRSWWDTVDTLAAHTVGPLVQQARAGLSPTMDISTMDIWVDHDDMWLRRTAILHQLFYKLDTDQDRLFGYCLARSHESEFFIRKAIGWALRQYARVAPDDVVSFVAAHDERWSGLTRREALKHLTPTTP